MASALKWSMQCSRAAVTTLVRSSNICRPQVSNMCMNNTLVSRTAASVRYFSDNSKDNHSNNNTTAKSSLSTSSRSSEIEENSHSSESPENYQSNEDVSDNDESQSYEDVADSEDYQSNEDVSETKISDSSSVSNEPFEVESIDENYLISKEIPMTQSHPLGYQTYVQMPQETPLYKLRPSFEEQPDPDSSPDFFDGADTPPRVFPIDRSDKWNILGVNLDPNRPIGVALIKIYGIGWFHAKQVCAELGVNPLTRLGFFEYRLPIIREHLEAKYLPKHMAMKKMGDDIIRKIQLGTYVGMRHQLCLPVRNQNSNTNGQTQRKLGKMRMQLYKFPNGRHGAAGKSGAKGAFGGSDSASSTAPKK